MATKAELTKLYVEVRDRIAARKAEFDKADVADKEVLRKIELVLLAKMDADGEESVRTEFGTAYVATSDFAQVGQWDAFIQFVKENEAYDMIEKRCSKTAVREYLKAANALPPGINYGTKREINVRRPSAKS